MRIKKDFHGYRVEQAIREVEDLVYRKITRDVQDIELVTGHGKIRDAIVDFLDAEGIEWISLPNNWGMVRFRLY